MGRLKGAARRVRNFLDGWEPAILLGIIVAAAVWTVWYVSKVPCIPAAADAGLCNPGIIANYINVDILIKAGSSGAAATAVKGGYDRYMMRDMLKREREALGREREALEREQNARQSAEAQLVKARAEASEAIARANQRADEAYEMAAEMVRDFRAERQQAEEERRRQAAAQQAILEAMLELLQRQVNGGRPAGNDDSAAADGQG